MNGIRKFVDIYGTQAKAAEAAGVRQQVLNRWLKEIKKPSAIRAVHMEKVSGVSRAEIRPDVFCGA